MTLLSWRNSFYCEVFAPEGQGACRTASANGDRARSRFASGSSPAANRPKNASTVERPDPTWALEYEHFVELCAAPATDLARDLWIDEMLQSVAATA